MNTMCPNKQLHGAARWLVEFQKRFDGLLSSQYLPIHKFQKTADENSFIGTVFTVNINQTKSVFHHTVNQATERKLK